MNSVRRVLIIRGSAIGDVIHATPLSVVLKEAYPHLEITWIVEEICGDVVLGNPYLHEVIVTPRSRWKQGRLTSPRIWGEYLGFLRSLRARRFDVTLDLQGYAKSAILALAARAPYRLGWWRQRDGANLVNKAIPRRAESVHRVDWFLDVARALGAEPHAIHFPLHIPDAAREYITALLRKGGIDPTKPYAVLNQAAGDQARRWTEAGFAQVAWQLALHYNMPSVLVGVTSDQQPNAAIIAQYRELANTSNNVSNILSNVSEPLDLAGQTNLKQLFALINGCALQISGDTGSLHIADAFNRPLIGLYGSSDPAHAGPYHQQSNILSRRDLCRPDCTVRRCAFEEEEKTEQGTGNREQGTAGTQSAIGNRQSKISQPSTLNPQPAFTSRCLQAITLEQVMRKVAELLPAQALETSGGMGEEPSHKIRSEENSNDVEKRVSP